MKNNYILEEHKHCKHCGRIIIQPSIYEQLADENASPEIQLKVIAYKTKTCKECLIKKLQNKKEK